MLIKALTAFHQAAASTPVLVSEGREWFAEDLLDLSRRYAASLEQCGEQDIAFLMRESAGLVAAVAAAAHLGRDVTILNAGATGPEIARLIERFGYRSIVGDADAAERLPAVLRRRVIACEPMTGKSLPALVGRAGGPDGRLNILTSGTTGEPTTVGYAWRDLAAQVVLVAGTGRRWLLAYQLNHFAGIQVLLHTMLNRDTLVVAKAHDVPSLWSAAARAGVTHISSTPTFWRMVMAAREPAISTLRHVTLGGEIVTQDVLDCLATRYPTVTVSQVYASTELGSIVSVKDGRSGLPLKLFGDTAQGPALFKIVDSELMVRRTEGATDYRATGDLVARQGDRVVFLGRKSEAINVGGVKVHPHTVEAAVSSLDGIVVALAAGEPNPITGQIVRLDVVLREGFRREEVESRIRDVCRPLGRHAQPRRVRYLDAIETTNLKLRRRACQ